MGRFSRALYDPSFQAPPLAVALLFAGSLVRIAAWIPLFGLYAASRTRAIAVGELLSLPLFAALAFAAGDRLTLEIVGRVVARDATSPTAPSTSGRCAD